MNNLTVRPSLLGRSVFDDIFLTRKDFKKLLNRTTEGYPVTDIYDDNDGNTIMEFALAGFTKEELSIEVRPEDSTITVKASSDSSSDLPKRIARRSFEKTYINYDSHLDLKSTMAEYKNGLLRVKVPPRAEAQSVKVDIESA